MIVSIDEAVKILESGGNVAVPTETVYGLAALYDKPKAIESIFTLKGRPRENPLIIHAADIAFIESKATQLPESFYALAEAFWPGPMALAVEVKQGSVLELVTASLPKACFRIPDHPLALDVIVKAGPLVMPSANLSGKPSPTDPFSVMEDLGSAFPVLDGGSCLKGLESTILIFEEGVWHLGRLGSLPLEEIELVLGYAPIQKSGGIKPLCPGQMWRHYAPKARLITSKTIPDDFDAIIGFDERKYPSAKPFFSLGSLETPSMAASRFYSHLRELDRKEIKSAWIDVDFPDMGLFRTLKERILKASGK